MSRISLGNILTVSAVSLGGWLAGSTFEKHKTANSGHTVLAASPLATVEDDGNKRNVVLPDVIPAESKQLSASRTGQIMRFGFPSFDQLKSMDDYVLSYDRRNRTAHWVFEHFTHADLRKNESVDRTKCRFQEDVSVHPFFRANSSDYKGSGFDRGHLAAAGNHRRNQKECDQTFLLSNIAPQVGEGFNRGAWNNLEIYVRHLTKIYKNVYVCTGPLYLPRKESDGKMYVKYQVIGANNVAVPTHFFKIVLGETDKSELEVEAYLMPNAVIDENASIFSYKVPLEAVERAAGLLFFDKIPRNRLKLVNGRKNFL